MPTRWLRAYLTMLPRLQAEEALGAAEISVLPHLAPDNKRTTRSTAREQWFARMQRQARGLSADTQYDALGRRVLNTGQDLRDFFNSHFGPAGLPTLNA